MKCSTLAALLTLAGVLTPIAIALQNSKVRPGQLDVGQIAPPIGEIEWLKLGADAKQAETDVAAMRGRVVVIADYGYYCDSCTRVGVPLVKALRASNDPAELVVITLTAGIGNDTNEVIRAKGEALGLTGFVGIADVLGTSSPYLDMNANGNLTYAFVIGRHGGIVWKGDPSRKPDEYLVAVSKALQAVPSAPLPKDPTAFGPEITPALRDYVLGDFVKAEAGAQALLKKLGTRSGAGAEVVRTEANALMALIETTRRALMDELEKTGGAKDAEHFPRALMNVRRAFSKGPEIERASALELSVTESDQGATCRQWTEWYALEAARPATFPASKDPTGIKYARQLSSYAKQPGVPGLKRVQAWLEAFERAVVRK